MENDATIPAAEVQAELDRILASKGFTGAGRQSRMLRYIVERTLAGQTADLKEYAVGVDVFDRDEQYDPRIDSIVRVEAGRLRARIDDYYRAEGAENPVRITLPRGGYVPQFERPQTSVPVLNASAGAVTAPTAGPRMPRWLTGTAAVAAILVVASITAWRARPIPEPGGIGHFWDPARPTIAVLAFEQYSADADGARLAAEITDGVTSELARLSTVWVASHTSAMRFKGTRTPLNAIAAVLNADVILEGSITEDGGGLQLTVRLVDPIADRKIWVESFAGRRGELQDLERRVAAAASTAALTRRN